MRRTMAVVAAITVVSLGFVCGYAWAEDRITRDAVQELLDKAAAAFDARDIDGIASTATPEAILQYVDGSIVPLKVWKEETRKSFADTATMRSSFKVEVAEDTVDMATAKYTEIHEYTLVSDPSHGYRSVSHWTAALVKTGEGWRFTHFRELSDEVTRDGEPYTPEPGTARF